MISVWLLILLVYSASGLIHHQPNQLRFFRTALKMSTSGSYHLHVKLVPNPKRAAEFIACIQNNQKCTLDKSKEPGCIIYKWGESTTEPGVYYFTEQYESEEAFLHHTQQPHFAEWEKYAGSDNAFVSEPEVSFWREM